VDPDLVIAVRAERGPMAYRRGTQPHNPLISVSDASLYLR
jgi:hypothetical protein